MPRQSLLSTPKTHRFLVYKSAASQTYLCVCAATSARHALRIARQNGFTLTKTAFARHEPQTIPPVAA